MQNTVYTKINTSKPNKNNKVAYGLLFHILLSVTYLHKSNFITIFRLTTKFLHEKEGKYFRVRRH